MDFNFITDYFCKFSIVIRGDKSQFISIEFYRLRNILNR